MATHASWLLPEDDAAAQFARESIAPLVAEHPRFEDIQLVVSEMASNAFRHGSPPQSMTVEVDGAAVSITVRQRATVRRPTLQSPDSAPGGLGLHLISSLADEWGWSLTAADLVVWARFR